MRKLLVCASIFLAITGFVFNTLAITDHYEQVIVAGEEDIDPILG